MGQDTQSTRHRPVIALLSAAVLFFYWRIDPYGLPGPLFCWFRRLTGWYCPGCGSTRALHAMMHGDLRAVLAYNVLAPVALIGALILAWMSPRRLPRWFWVGALATAVVFGVVRNLFSVLAPPR
ncbi:MAG: DUF2752 domain-containing protein [Armatimonadetes bacterium]|nr:DUF2752 domain-containing protein [Armatimonadota bacterium]